MSEVDLISSPENCLEIIYTACRTCYSADNSVDIFETAIASTAGLDVFENTNFNPKMLGLIEKVLTSKHHSTIEHINFVFSISGVSRACTHQLVRHRHMSFSQKSQRYVTETGQFEYVIPESIESHSTGLSYEYDAFMYKIGDFYQRMIEQGIPAEDARFILPNAATSSMIASLNLRELIHLANLRLCTNAQWEIRGVVQKMCDLVIAKEPWLTEYLVPQCERDGKCEEIRGCGKYGK